MKPRRKKESAENQKYEMGGTPDQIVEEILKISARHSVRLTRVWR